MFQVLDTDIKIAMKAKEKEKLSVLRFLKAALKDIVINEKKEITDEIFIDVASKKIKQCRDSIEGFQKGGRDELVEKEQFSIDILKHYMPKQLSEEELNLKVKDILTKENISSKKEMSLAMKAVMAELKGKAEGKLINKAVMNNLN